MKVVRSLWLKWQKLKRKKNMNMYEIMYYLAVAVLL